MKNIKKSNIIISISETSVSFYADFLEAKVAKKIPQGIFEYKELGNSQKFSLLLQDVLLQYEKQIKGIYVVLDPGLTFIKDISQLSVLEQQESIHDYLEIVPFEKVQSRVYRYRKEAVIVATNQEVILEVELLCESMSIPLRGVFPLEILFRLLGKNEKKLSLEEVSKHIDRFRSYSLQSVSESHEGLIDYSLPQWRSPRVIILLSTFVVLVGVLSWMILSQIVVQKPVTTSPSRAKLMHNFLLTPTSTPSATPTQPATPTTGEGE